MSRVMYSPTFVVQSAQSMRSRMSTAHEQLWANLSNGQSNVRFRRQHPIGNHVVDFYCRKHKIIVETGSRGNHKDRDTYLNACGYTVLRFTESEVKNNCTRVIKCIESSVKRAEIKNVIDSRWETIKSVWRSCFENVLSRKVLKAEVNLATVN